MAKKIKVTIPLKGISAGKRKVKIESPGYTGESCRDATKAFEDAIGGVENEELTADYYAGPDTEERLYEGGS